jgi:hypothetical protein
VALSLNNFAYFLNEDDEIIFVDWNSPRNLNTFPERISDTLSPKCKSILKIIKVDESIHRKLRQNTRKPTIEPIARNVGIVRSDQKSKWILSTNTDMLFVQKDKNLPFLEVIEKLIPGFYALPRFEIPEYIWDQFNRYDPIETISDIKNISESISLKQVVKSTYFNRYDAPGDFQLFPREDVFKIRGFDEQMIKGWHVDSNLSKRFYSYFGEVKSLSDSIEGYHCNHSTIKTHFISNKEVNDEKKFVINELETVVNSSSGWGLESYDLPIIKLNDKKAKMLRIFNNIPKNNINSSILHTYNLHQVITRDLSVSMPFLLDLLQGSKKNDVILYVGFNSSIKDYLEKISKYFDIEISTQTYLDDQLSAIKNAVDLGKHVYILMDFSCESENSNFQVGNQIDEDVFQIHEKNIEFLFSLNEYMQNNQFDSECLTIISHHAERAIALGLLQPLVTFNSVSGYSGLRESKLKQSFISSSKVRLSVIKFIIKVRLDIVAYNIVKYNIDYNFSSKNFISHQVINVLKSKKRLYISYLGIFIGSGDEISIGVSLPINKYLVVLEMDVPENAHAPSSVNFNYFNKNDNESKNKKFNVPREHHVIILNPDSRNSLVFRDTNTNEIPLIRLTNLTLFDKNIVNRKNFYWASDPLSSIYYRAGWSYSNEIIHRRAVGNSFEINLHFRPKNSRRVYVSLLYSNNQSKNVQFKNQENGKLISKYGIFKITYSPSNVIYSFDLSDNDVRNLNLTIPELRDDDLIFTKFIYFSKHENMLLAKIAINYRYYNHVLNIRFRNFIKILKRRIIHGLYRSTITSFLLKIFFRIDYLTFLLSQREKAFMKRHKNSE